MQLNVAPVFSYSNPEVEGYINAFEAETVDFAQLQGKSDGQRETPLSEMECKIKVVDPLFVKGQQAIDFVRQTLLVPSQAFSVAELEAASKKRMADIQNEIDDKRQKQAPLIRKRNLIPINELSRKYGKWLAGIAIVVGIADGLLSLWTLQVSYPAILALFRTNKNCLLFQI